LLTSASAGGSASTGSTFLAAFFLGAAFLPLAPAFPFPFAVSPVGFPPPAFSIYAFLTSSTDFPDLSSSITSYNIDSWTPSRTTVDPPYTSSYPTNSFFLGLSLFLAPFFFGAAFFLAGAFFFAGAFFTSSTGASSTG